MEFFGWLTKGKCQVSLLDILIFFAEIGILFFIYAGVYLSLGKIKGKK